MIVLHRCKLPEHVAREMQIKVKGQSLSDMLVEDAWSDFEQVNKEAYVKAYGDDIVEAHIQLNGSMYTTTISQPEEDGEQHEFVCSVSMIRFAANYTEAAKIFVQDLRRNAPSIGDVQVRRTGTTVEVTVDTQSWTEV